MYTKCRCMGYSGSCSVKHCWKSMPDVHQLTDETFDRYDRAIQITSDNEHSLLNGAADLASSLVYHQKNDYCATSSTSGRKCDPNKSGPGSCDYICCGKGHRTKKIKRKVSIQNTCVYTFPISIKCEQEEKIFTEHYCR